MTQLDTQPDCTITDPPYDQRTSLGGARAPDAARRIDFDGLDSLDWLTACRPRRWTVAFCALEQLGDYAKASGPSWVRAGVWHRWCGPQKSGDRPAQEAEGIAIMHPPGRKRWNGCGYGAFWTGNKDALDIEGNDHPTIKPLWLMMDLIQKFTGPGELVLDPFCGSGTTGVACLRLGRHFIGIERDARYAKIATDRLTAESEGNSLDAYQAGQLTMFGGTK